MYATWKTFESSQLSTQHFPLHTPIDRGVGLCHVEDICTVEEHVEAKASIMSRWYRRYHNLIVNIDMEGRMPKPNCILYHYYD